MQGLKGPMIAHIRSQQALGGRRGRTVDFIVEVTCAGTVGLAKMDIRTRTCAASMSLYVTDGSGWSRVL